MLPSGSSNRNEEKSQNIVLKPYSKTAAKEARRSRGEIACAECRRLKVRCNRQIPCATCIGRGCAALCPNGTLPPGDNSRFVSQATDHLQRRITKMAERMRALEDALAIAQAAETSQPHPLLTTEIEQDTEVDISVNEEKVDVSIVDSVVESFGTLHIDENERTVRFFGTSGGSEGSAQNPPLPGAHKDLDPVDLKALGLPEEIACFFYSFPLAPLTIPATPVRHTIESFLPSWDRAEALGRMMLDSMSWMFSIVTLRQYTQELMPYVYLNKGGGRDNSAYRGSHGLALFLAVLAVGSLIDPSLPPYHSDAQRYYVLAIVALGLEPILAHHSLSTVKTLHLLSVYCGMSGSETNMHNQFALLHVASSLARTVGYVDPTHWNMSDEDVYDRRSFYWNLLQGDTWQSIYSGRPSALMSVMTDCQIPSEDDEAKFQQGEYALGFGIWGHRCSEELLIPAMKLLVAPKQPTYQAVLELDKKIRLFNPPSCELYLDSPSTAVSMRWFSRSHYKELSEYPFVTPWVILALHRSFFAQALALNPTNPLDTPYKFSFLSAYEAACIVLDRTSQSFTRRPHLLSRIWMIWTFGFSSAVIVGAVASRCKNINIQPSPLRVLECACTLFEKASTTNSRAAAALVIW
ncbi:hypothetical protein BC835DRAFT_1271862 [Cytidiella melzeri]|nr:hypothetical protein BC835DRAFT_1271862 [Cytidiella melzeri]